MIKYKAPIHCPFAPGAIVAESLGFGVSSEQRKALDKIIADVGRVESAMEKCNRSAADAARRQFLDDIRRDPSLAINAESDDARNKRFEENHAKLHHVRDEILRGGRNLMLQILEQFDRALEDEMQAVENAGRAMAE